MSERAKIEQKELSKNEVNKGEECLRHFILSGGEIRGKMQLKKKEKKRTCLSKKSECICLCTR